MRQLSLLRQVKDTIPRPWRLRYQLWQRKRQDRAQGWDQHWAKRAEKVHDFPWSINVEQPIRPGTYYQNKVHNLQLAAMAISPYQLAPGQVFSFWHCIGPPTARRGYKAGRNLIGGRLQADVGGGLCQLAGAIYYLVLNLGLPVLERHHHSRDIYTEAERFTPLGADATVVYGYKDLRFRNTTQAILTFTFAFSPEQLQVRLWSTDALEQFPLEFPRTPLPDGRVGVTTLRAGKAVAESVYI